VYTDHRALLERADIDVVDVALHPDPRGPVLRDAILAGKHVLSQKPFTRDLDEGAALVNLAAEKNVRLAVNQNGRWAPYTRWVLQAIRAGLIGEVQSVDIRLGWDHTWIRGKAFERIHHIILYDFAVHWFDLAVQCFGARPARRVFARAQRAPGQDLRPPLLASALVEFDHGQATLQFDGHVRAGPEESLVVTGSAGTLRTRGPVCANDTVELHTAAGVARPRLEGHWFREGFRGTMGELLCAIEDHREPEHSARDNLRTLDVVFAAIASADSGAPVTPGTVRRLGASTAVGP
jgi:predicted dehydrogenase